MRKFRMLFSIIVVFLCAGVVAFAAPITAPTNIRIVQKDNGTYATIKAALDSINAANSVPSESNPYLIKVMPGIYVETVPVAMTAYVDIVGSGQNNTIISMNAAGTVLTAADHTAVENLTITTNVQDNGTSSLISIGNNISTTFRNVSVKLPTGLALPAGAIQYESGSKFSFINSRVYSDGTLGHIGQAIGSDSVSNAVVEMTNSSIVLATNQENVANATYFGGGDVTIRDSEISIAGNGGAYAVDGSANIRIMGSVIKASTNTGGACAACTAQEIQDSQIIATSVDGIDTWGVRGGNNMAIRNSYLSGTSMGIFSYDPASEPFRVGNSQIVNGHNGQVPSRVVNCYDGNFEPIPNLIPQP